VTAAQKKKGKKQMFQSRRNIKLSHPHRQSELKCN